MPDCSEMNESQCNQYGDCDWIESEVDCEDLNSESNCNSYDCDWNEDIEYGNCSNYNNSSSCDSAHQDCYWDLCYGGYYGSWSHCCRGGTFEINNSYLNNFNIF